MSSPWFNQLKKEYPTLDLPELGVSRSTFSANYQEDFSVSDALVDLTNLATVDENHQVQASLHPISRAPGEYSIKLYTLKDAIPLSHSMPILESMGLNVLIGRPYRIRLSNLYWIHHFTLGNSNHICDINLNKVPRYFSELFKSVWNQSSEKDNFNHLLFRACLKARDIQILRAYTAYLQQIQFPHSRSYIIQTLNTYPDIALLLVQYFLHRFDPEQTSDSADSTIVDTITHKLQGIGSLDHDLIVKRLLNLIQSTVRTNYFQASAEGRSYLSFKLDSKNIENLPKPSPRYEIFVYAARFEGIHLRGGLVARGGIRWSDRREDYRTEVLGLMKAQMVKNAVIVPAGSKGGFITKQIAHLPASEVHDEVQTCYALYIKALLEMTDDRVGEAVRHPLRTVIHDHVDPYLVVAADKGTAAFSDIANSIAESRGFWLDDAFASGGSQGYDHKKMGITARGAWESVKRHFRGLGKDIQTEDCTVVGIGDMSGDVFGNGMLLSPHIKLLAAFNHLHIFVDPTPDPKRSYAERQRLFALPASTWNNYDKKLLSRGGGIFSRLAKRIELTAEMQQLFNCRQDHVTPNELITCLLKMPVDLIWNGGIGTYIKASSETNATVSDKNNDVIRIDGRQVAAKVIGEGGNLGVTQKGRIEFAQHGGLIYTDSIDNSAGVDCSDHEVNIKILLSQLVNSARLTQTARNQLLAEMTDDVAIDCLRNNYRQTQIIDSIQQNAGVNIHQHARFIRHLEREGILDRQLEALPDDEQITRRIGQNQGLTRPELCILLSYSKLTYKNALLESSTLQEACYNPLLLEYFPEKLGALYTNEILHHPLRKEIIATLLSNKITNYIGIGFGYRIREETGATIENIAKAYVVCVEVFDLNKTWQALEKLDNVVTEQHRYECFRTVSGLLERSISWILRNKGSHFDVSLLIDQYQADIQILRKMIATSIVGQSRKNYLAARRRFLKYRLPTDLAQQITDATVLASAFDMIEITRKPDGRIEHTVKLFYALSERLQLHWIRDMLSQSLIRNHWHHLAIVNMRNDLHTNQRNLAEIVLQSIAHKRYTSKAMPLWEAHQGKALDRYDHILKELSALQMLDFATISVAVSEVQRLVTCSQQALSANG